MLRLSTCTTANEIPRVEAGDMMEPFLRLRVLTGVETLPRV